MRDKDFYMELLKNPPKNARGYTRWWWYGCSVTPEEIKRELNFMREAHIGGVEIQILYPVHQDNPKKNIRHIQFFSPEFFEIIDYTLDTAKEMDLEVDFTLGSGWPFGGPFITKDMSPDILIHYQHDVTGPSEFSFDYSGIFAGKIIKVIMGRMDNGTLQEESLRDITHHLKSTYVYSWPWGSELVDVDIPPGQWKIMAFVSSDYRQPVGIPAPGMEGYAMDHCRKDVADFYFKNFGQSFIDKLGRGRIRSFFCDSIELEGNNWTSILLEEFKKRRGYDLAPYMPALWMEVGDITPYIRFDYYKTMSELTIENFFENFTCWCNQNGVKSRIQAHGTWGDILKAYAAADIPEGETFGEGDCYEVNTVHRRLASSAGNVYGRDIISNESFTWLRMPRFLVNLEMIKRASDAIFLDGINHIINHGYSYSPQEVGEPGWVFYASSLISHTNTWWRYYPIVSRYIQKVSAFLQRGRNYSEVGVYLPQNDIWADSPMATLHMSMKLEQYIGKEAINNIQKNGYWFNYLNDEGIQELGTVKDGGIEINHNLYKMIILPGVKRMPVKTALRLQEFVKAGGILVAAEGVPQASCGYLNREENNRRIRSVIQQMFPRGTNEWSYIGKGRTVITSDRGETMIQFMKKGLQPDVELCSGRETIGFVHRRDGEHDIYFMANVSRDFKTSSIKFKVDANSVQILEPVTEEVIYPVNVEYQKDGVLLELNFEPNQSFLIIFSKYKTKEIPSLPKIEKNTILDLTEDWTLEVEPLNFSTQMHRVSTWESLEETRYYCGQAVYKKNIKLNSSQLAWKRISICFDEIHEVAEVWINGVCAGVLWKAPFVLDITPHVREGDNKIEVKVVNLWINEYLNPDREEFLHSLPLIEEWPYFTSIIDQVRARRLYSWREKEMVKELQPSGLCGEVVLIGENWASDRLHNIISEK